jgi:hypothetical protein
VSSISYPVTGSLGQPLAGQFVPIAVPASGNFNLLDFQVYLSSQWRKVFLTGIDQNGSGETFENLILMSFNPLHLPTNTQFAVGGPPPGLGINAIMGRLPGAFPLLWNNGAGSSGFQGSYFYEFCNPLPSLIYINGFAAGGSQGFNAMLFFTNSIAKLTNINVSTSF